MKKKFQRTSGIMRNTKKEEESTCLVKMSIQNIKKTSRFTKTYSELLSLYHKKQSQSEHLSVSVCVRLFQRNACDIVQADEVWLKV